MMTTNGQQAAGGGPVFGDRWRRGVQLSGRDLELLGWIGEQYCVRGDLLGVLMAARSVDPAARAAGRVAPRLVQRRVAAWRGGGLVASAPFLANTPGTVWLTGEGMATAGLSWRAYEPTFATVAHRHAVGVVRAHIENRPGRLGWTCERELREGQGGGRRDHLADGVVTSVDQGGREWRTAIEVELTRKTRPRVEEIVRGLLGEFDDVVYYAAANTAPVLRTVVAALGVGERVRIRPYPLEGALAEVA